MTADLETQTLDKMTVCSAEVKMTQQTSDSAHFPPPISIFSRRQLLSPSCYPHNIYNDCWMPCPETAPHTALAKLAFPN